MRETLRTLPYTAALMAAIAIACGGSGTVAPRIDPETVLASVDAPVYWLGGTLEPNDSYPALVLQDVSDNRLVYSGADGEYDRGLVELELFEPGAWAAGDSPEAQRACQEDEVMSLADREVTLTKLYHDTAFLPSQHCPPPDTFVAVVRFADAVVEIAAPALDSEERSANNPYNTEAGIELLARTLEAGG